MLLIPNLGLGGAQRDFGKLAQVLQNDYEVHVAVFNTVEGVDIYGMSCKIIDLDVPHGETIWKKLVYFKERYKKIKRLKKREKYDACISYMEGANYLNVLTRGNIKAIISARGSIVHDSTIEGKIGLFRKRILIPFLYKKADAIVALNNGIKREIADCFKVDPQKIKVIYNHYDVEKIQEKALTTLSSEVNSYFSQPTIILSGRLAPEKGFDHVMRVFSLMQKQDTRIVILGEGPERAKLESIIEEKGLDFTIDLNKKEAQIFFSGYTENVYPYLSKGTVLVISSTSEGGPNVMLEAMICGLPVVSVDCPYGPAERMFEHLPKSLPIRGERGVLLPQFDGSEEIYALWAKYLDDVLKDKDYLRSVTENAKKYIASFDLSAMRKKWVEVIEG